MESEMNQINSFAIVLAAAATFATAAHAVLPAASDASKEQAKEAAAKAAWQDKVGAYKLCQVQDKVADAYRKDMKGEGKAAPQPVSTAPCQDPGVFATPVSQKPLEASEAHSPPGNATSPPSTKAHAADLMPSKKPN
jgi:hypothetical protein